MKNRPYHTNSALQTWEEKNYTKLMSKKIHAAKSTIPKLPGSKKPLPSHNTGSVGQAAAHQGHWLPASIEPEDAGCANRICGVREAPLGCQHPSNIDLHLTAFVSPAKHASSRPSRYGRVAWLDEHPPELALTPSPAVPCSLPPATCLPQLQPVPAQQSTAVAAPTGSFPQPAAALPLQPCHLPHALPLVRSTTSASSSAVTHRAQGHGLPPIPGPSTQTSWSPHKGQKIALSKEGKKDAGVRPGKQQGQRQAASRVPRDRANKGGPVWNSDFSIQYEEPLSMKDQERVLKHAALGRFKRPHASAACREQSAGVVMNKLTSVSPSMWPPLSKVTQHPAVLQNSRRQQTTSATCHRSKAAARSQSGDGAHMDSAVVEPRGREQSKGRACNNKLRGGSIAYSRNLDSAQSPLRSAKGVISDGEAALCNLNKFCFLPFQVSANDKGQAITASTASIPPLLNAAVHSQQSSQDESYGSPVASFLMHSSSMTPLRPSQLESSSPNHPLFLHTSLQQQAISLQQSPCSSQQLPAALKASLHSSQQSPASLQHRQISAQQSPVRSWKSLRPESRATLDGSSESLPELQGKTGMGSVHPAGILPMRLHALAASDRTELKKAAANVHQGRAGSLEVPLQKPAAITPLPVQGVQSTTHHKGCLSSTQTKPLHIVSDLDSTSQPASKQEIAFADCTHQYSHCSSSSCSMPPDAAVGTVNGSSRSCSPGRCSLVPASNAHEFVDETGVDAGSGLPSSSMLVTNVTTGAQNSTVRLASPATDSFADCSSTVSRFSFPFMVGCQHAGASTAAVDCSSASNELQLLSALNSADLTYLSGEPPGSMLAGEDVEALCSSSVSTRRGTKGSSNGTQAASKSTGPGALAEKSAPLEGSSNGQSLARVGSMKATRHPAMHGHGGPSMLAEPLQPLGSDDEVLSGGDPEVLLLGQHSNSSVAAGYMTAETNAHAHCGCSDGGAKLAEKGGNERLHSRESGLNRHHTSDLPAMHASCDSLYDDNDWEA